MMMSATCPSCGTHLSPWALRRDFPCPNCRISLKANVVSRFALAFALWIPLDFLILLVAGYSDTWSPIVSILGYGLLSSALLFAVAYFALSGARITQAGQPSNA